MNVSASKAPAGHFAFGENWSKFADIVDEKMVDEATRGFQRLLGDVVAGKSVIDIGCGSGLHALAALRAGAASVRAIDVDPRSVDTTRRLLGDRAPRPDWDCRLLSVFDLDPDIEGRFDIVYSWGALHHTGAMYDAIAQAASLVKPGGFLCLALYNKTPLCGFWRFEKKVYSCSS
jgi:2-polyprenyl-3-methyl-5-hydroxy-6-metoxy-1,4-benzoquinol methylase